MTSAIASEPVAIPRVVLPAASRDRVLEEALSRRRPVVFVDVASAWTDRARWAPSVLGERFRGRDVPVVRIASSGAAYDPRTGVAYESVPVDRYIAAIESGARDLYLSCSVRAHLPELLGELSAPRVVARAGWRHERLWVAAKGQGGPLHIDLPHNLYLQLSGRKRFTLVSRWQSHRVYPHPPWSGVPNYARVDADVPDLARHPRFRGATRLTAELEPGDALYIPSLDWHQARALETSVSINLWWADGNLARVARLAEAFKHLRGLSL